MKAKTSPRDLSRVLHCVDALNQHYENAWAVAMLLALCQEVDAPELEPRVVGHAARIIATEMEQVHDWTQGLLEEMCR